MRRLVRHDPGTGCGIERSRGAAYALCGVDATRGVPRDGRFLARIGVGLGRHRHTRIADSGSTTYFHVAHPAIHSRGPQGRPRVLGRPRHERGAALDAGERRDSVRVHREPGPARRERLRRDPAQGLAIRRRDGTPRRLPRRAGRGRHRRFAGGRVPHLDRGPHVLQHDSDRARRDGHDARHRDARGRRPHMGRRQHVQGQRHRALLPLWTARQSRAAHLQAVARRRVHRRAGRPQGDVGVPPQGGVRLQDEHGEGVLHRLQSARRDPRGEGPRVPRQGHAHRAADHGRRFLARRRGGQGRDRERALRGRPSRGAQRADVRATKSR